MAAAIRGRYDRRALERNTSEQPQSDGPPDEAAYYIRQGGDIQGPFPLARMRAFARRLKLRPEMEVSEDRATWVPARTMPAFFESRGRRRRVRTRGWTFLHTMKTYTPKTHATTALIVLNVLVFVAVVVETGTFTPAAGAFVDWGANHAPRTTQGEWWRLLTCTFLHADVLHLALNMVVFFYIGRLMERLLGRGGFLVLYVFAGLTGSLASMLVNDALISVGASGSIFGLFGGILGFIARRSRDPIARSVLGPAGRTAAIYMLIELGLGWRSGGVDYGGHLGGFIGGFGMALGLAHALTPEGVAGRPRRAALGAVTGLLVVVGVAALMTPVDEARGPLAQFEMTEHWLVNAHGEAAGYGGEGTEEERLAVIRVLETRVLPAWEKTVRRLESVSNPPRHHAARVVAVRAYARQRLELLELRLALAKTQDGALHASIAAAEERLERLARARWSWRLRR